MSTCSGAARVLDMTLLKQKTGKLKQKTGKPVSAGAGMDRGRHPFFSGILP